MIRILHTADLHLDSPLKSLALRDPYMRDSVQTATRTALVRLVDTALSENVAALLIAGDLFDGAARSAKTAAFLVTQFDRLAAADIPVFYIKGNHDAENPITGEAALPANVHIFDGRGGKTQLPNTDIWIHGVSFRDRHAPDSLLDKFSAPVADAINIGMLHTSLAGAAGHDTYAPCTVADLQKMGFDYWALGHIHKRRVYCDAPWIVMPGIPQGRDIGEAGPQSATMLEIVDGAITLREIPTAAVIFHTAEIDVTTLTGDDQLRGAIRTALRDNTTPDSTRILRLRLTGQSDRYWQILRDQSLWEETIRTLAHETGQIWIDKVRFDLSPPATATHSATDELAEIMQAMRGEPGIAARLTDLLETTLSELPAQARAALVPTPDALATLTQELTGQGTAQMIALMKGASE
ncbi:DNA repair exonuclease [Loktanella sp. D2R18]|uniref:metallophosphoesterase family protein n=1 Tax=Rhodobacterales TaxID=204455 RepID=UPI000DE80291|nr:MULTISPECIES: DNA repair exonuclease [Rhodobacterales]MDO6590036.1 DNA repair exonuclease [Yoonia sp. 1_MG-2023]RBW46018.1 DNA repair exonuclease [Loktanella sp. D2R18]